MVLTPVNPKPDFVKLELKLLKFWQNSKILKKYLQKNAKSKRKFSFLDGPITANNPMGVHHAWGRTYKDLWQRFYNMAGFRQRFQNGFDEQGLWVEVEVEKELGLKNKKDIENLVPGDKFASIAKFVNLCKERVAKYSAIQTEQSKRLGYFMDWDNSYHTSSDANNYAIWNFLAVCNLKGYIYKGRDSVSWCPRCGTAISQHEILTEEYQEVTHKAVYVKYQLKAKSQKSKVNLLVWTTTPWTLLSNVAIAVHPNFKYGVWKTDDEELILSKDRAKFAGFTQKPKKVLKGKDLVGLKYVGVFTDLPALAGIDYRIVAARDLVKEEEGTGLVHIAPGAGEEDFDLAAKEKLPVIASIDEAATYIEGFGKFTGKNAKDNPNLVIDELKKRDRLLKIENYTHRYPVCWRCKTELVFRVVDEWYIAMDRIDPDDQQRRTLRTQMIDVAAKIKWIPKWGLDRELDWLKNMGDWLISKKRYWGLALPIWECQSCGYFDVIGSADELKKKAVAGWEKFAGHSPHRPWIDEIKVKCQKCGEKVLRIADVGNPWLDAGIVPFSTMPTSWFPADFITESFPGQFKNWFYSLIAMSTVLVSTNPVKTVLGFATLLDEKGEPMHKSKGNMIEFDKAAGKIGVDVMRWMYLSQNPEKNLLFGYHKADEVRRRFYLTLWNVYNFFVTYAAIDGWRGDKIKNSKLEFENILDRWIVSKFQKLIQTLTISLEKFDAATATDSIEDFIVNNLSTWYVRRSRDRVGPTATKGSDKNQAYHTLHRVLVNLSKLLAPFTPFISDEIYSNLTGELSVHLSYWPKFEKNLVDEKLESEMDMARRIVELTLARRKLAKLKVRQPISLLTTVTPMALSDEITDLIAKEVNVKKVKNRKGRKISVRLDLKITPQLAAEGQARELVRRIQEERKRQGLRLDEFIEVKLPSWPKEFEDYIMRQTLTNKISKGTSLEIKRLS